IGIRWGGIAGDGLQSMGISLAKYFNKLGFFSIGFPGTQSTIRGGHIWFHLEISDDSFHSYDRTSDILIALNEQSVEIHLTDLKIGGILIINSDTTSTEKYDSEIKRKKILVFNVPMTTITRKIDKKLDILKNTVIIGFLLKLLNLDRYEYSNSIKIYFKSKSKVINANIEALERGYLLFDDLSFDPSTYKLEPGKLQKNENIIITGNEAIALGAIVSDLKFLAQYPITPASSILKFIAQHADKFKIVVKQVEDEISAIISITAASWTGVRSMTATSGPGFSLMAEGLGYAGMTETPIVIVLSQRAGPSTGVPTKIEQADLLPALFSSHGEFPRCIIAPRNVQECFDATVKAFDIADRYSLPVIILTDFSLS
ncbi:MAG: 2-oxoacid:acceptor oxidoreductase family protein, partial [Candidatus Heimdallarchaeota archaeon]